MVGTIALSRRSRSWPRRLRHLLDLVAEDGNAGANPPPIHLELGLARAARADAAAEPRQRGAGADQPRQQVFQLGQLDLQLALAGAGPAGEDVEDQLGAIDHLAGDQILQLAQLGRRQLVVDDHDVDRGLGAGQRQRLRLAAADEGGRVGGGALLQRAYDRGGAGGVRQPFELVEGLFGVDPAHVAGDEPDESRALERGEPTFAHDLPAILHAYNRTPAAAAAHSDRTPCPTFPSISSSSR